MRQHHNHGTATQRGQLREMRTQHVEHRVLESRYPLHRLSHGNKTILKIIVASIFSIFGLWNHISP